MINSVWRLPMCHGIVSGPAPRIRGTYSSASSVSSPSLPVFVHVFARNGDSVTLCQLFSMFHKMKNILVVLLMISASYWGLFPHSEHCNLASKFGILDCPPHWVHVFIFGLGSYVAAVMIRQKDDF